MHYRGNQIPKLHSQRLGNAIVFSLSQHQASLDLIDRNFKFISAGVKYSYIKKLYNSFRVGLIYSLFSSSDTLWNLLARINIPRTLLIYNATHLARSNFGPFCPCSCAGYLRVVSVEALSPLMLSSPVNLYRQAHLLKTKKICND